MHNVSTAYKRAMDKPLRDRSFIQIGLGAINLEAQGTAEIYDTDLSYWSNERTVFVTDQPEEEYATYEQNFIKADGKLLFMPEENSPLPIRNVGVAANKILDGIKIKFDNAYAIKGLTINFGTKYPTEFTINDIHFNNDAEIFTTTQLIGEVDSLEIKPIKFVNGLNGRLRIRNMLMGVGLNFSNEDVSDCSYEEFVSAITEELPSIKFSANILDPEHKYNVDSKDSFINFLEAGQNVSVAYGTTLADGTVEWIPLCNLSLTEWSSTRGKFSFTADDIFANREEEYSLANRIYTRSAYTEIENVLKDMGLTPDDYDIDNYLAAVTLNNPIEPTSHKEALQVIANACRCYVTQDYNGKVIVRPNFVLVVEPEDIQVSDDNTGTAYSKVDNVLVGSTDVYGDFTQNFIRADGSQFILPTTDNYLNTGYVSKEIAKFNGEFLENPKIVLEMDAAYTFFGYKINFDGNPPKEMKVITYLYDSLVSTQTVTDLKEENAIFYEFKRFNKIVFEFTKGAANNRVLVRKISFGDYNDFHLTMNNMYEAPYGTRENTVKSVSVKIHTYVNETDNDGNIVPKLVDDDVWYTLQINNVGDNILVQNPLVSNEDMAERLAEWLGNYYKNNVNYEVQYRGDARLNAADIIHMDSDAINNLQVAVERHSLSYNGAWRGSLVLRKALRKGEEE